MAPELKRRRVVIELGKIDEILSWERAKEQEKGSRFAVLGEYLITQSPMNSKRLRQKRPRHKLDPAKYAIWTQVLERDGWRCQECGSMGGLDVHHMKPSTQLGGEVMYGCIIFIITIITSIMERPDGQSLFRGG